jgi:sugar phosphate isomerase/epimerase
MGNLRGLLVVACIWAAANVAAAAGNGRLTMQAYTFNDVTFYDTVARTKALGVKYVEAFYGQKVRDACDVAFGDMNSTQRRVVRQMLQEQGVKLVNYYAREDVPNSEVEYRKLFDFADEMGIEMIVSEPPIEALPLIDRLCREYGIGFAIHNHPKGHSLYWDPNIAIMACAGRSRAIGVCADTGHWMRSGIEPLGAIKKLCTAGRLKSIHFKDLNVLGDPNAHDVIWGAGAGKAKEILAELARQNYKGTVTIEYEDDPGHNLSQIKGCVACFKKAEAELSDVPVQDVFAPDLSNAVMNPGAWVFDANGVLSCVPGARGDIWTKELYGDFVLELDFKVPENGNSGVFIRTGNVRNPVNTGIEIQIHATTDGAAHGQCGAVYDCLSPSKTAVRKPGEWNHYIITCLDNKIYVNLNGEDIIDMDLDLWTEAHKNPDGSPNKFPTAYKDMPRAGYLGLQYHGNPVWFRNLKIKSLDENRPL